MNKSSNKIIVIMFIIFLVSINIFNLLTPDKIFSETENRMLAKAPKFSMKNLLSGKFTDKFEEYVTDQFTFRDFWVSVKSDIEILTLKTENNGIYFGKDGYLLEDYKKPDEQLIENVKSINNFYNKNPNILTHFLLVPNSVKIYEEKLPLFASPFNQIDTINKVKASLDQNINFIDVYEKLNSKKDEYIYFKTDHHWTTRGAYYAYQVFAKQSGFEAYNIDDFNIETVSSNFYGTFYSRSNNRHVNHDLIEIFRPKFDIDYKVNYLDNNKSSDSLYEYSYLDKKDKYSLFLDGNHALLSIKTNVNNGKKLIIFKDSYSHCFIPFLANHYEEIHVIDLRYYKLNIYDYIEEHQITEALFLYNVNTFSDDKTIQLLNIN
ncbi:DHHW family protein [Abyssisolibacter fermentans]|uniref:DHHW family protein n=1 Tax=Abyssisolibacter fermentans TaxID=1766203 RepID=UPI00082F8D19|nr:DHHW family protein [Abyssisolibacter fermentans]